MHNVAMSEIANETPTAPGRNARRKARTRSGLLAAARHLFATRGVEETTIGEIAEQADTGVGSLYNYFRTKDDVIVALLEEELGKELELLQARQAQVDDPAERVSVAHRSLLKSARDDSDLGWLFVRLDFTHEIGLAVMRPAALRDLKDGVKSGRFTVSNVEVAWRASAGALIGVMQGALRGEIKPAGDAAHVEGVLRSFGVSPEDAAEVASRPLPEVPVS